MQNRKPSDATPVGLRCTREIPGDRFFQKALRWVEMGDQEIVGVLRNLVVLCCAFGVNLQRTPREQSC
jgi:hypothetical protein